MEFEHEVMEELKALRGGDIAFIIILKPDDEQGTVRLRAAQEVIDMPGRAEMCTLVGKMACAFVNDWLAENVRKGIKGTWEN